MDFYVGAPPRKSKTHLVIHKGGWLEYTFSMSYAHLSRKCGKNASGAAITADLIEVGIDALAQGGAEALAVGGVVEEAGLLII